MFDRKEEEAAEAERKRQRKEENKKKEAAQGKKKKKKDSLYDHVKDNDSSSSSSKTRAPKPGGRRALGVLEDSVKWVGHQINKLIESLDEMAQKTPGALLDLLSDLGSLSSGFKGTDEVLSCPCGSGKSRL